MSCLSLSAPLQGQTHLFLPCKSFTRLPCSPIHGIVRICSFSPGPLLTAAFLPACVLTLCQHFSWSPPSCSPFIPSPVLRATCAYMGFSAMASFLGSFPGYPCPTCSCALCYFHSKLPSKFCFPWLLALLGSRTSTPGLARPPAGMGTVSPSHGMREEGCSLCGFCEGPGCPPWSEIGLCNSQLSAHAWHSPPETAKLHPGMFCWLFTTARLINSCLCACLPGEKLSPLWQVARCQKMQSPLLFSLFSSAACSQPTLQPPQCPCGSRGWHSAAAAS